MNVFFIFIFQLLSGWMFINGGNFYYDIQLKNELEKHNYDYDAIHDANEQLSPEIKEILTAITGDGGRNVFTLYFGWVYSIFYFIPYLIIFKIISYIKKKLSCNAAI